MAEAQPALQLVSAAVPAEDPVGTTRERFAVVERSERGPRSNVAVHAGQRDADHGRVGAELLLHASNAVAADGGDRKSTRLNSSHGYISYAVFCLKKKTTQIFVNYAHAAAANGTGRSTERCR